jgi:hypothetical protein
MEPPDRGGLYEHASRTIREIMGSHEDDLIEVACGVDSLCQHCPNLGEGRCDSPFGDEEKVRRWDMKVMEGLGLTYGDRKTAVELRRIIDQAVPLDFCRNRCPWKSICTVFDQTMIR